MSILKISILSSSLIITSFSWANENPNIIFILADDFGWSDLSFQNDEYYETPNLDKLRSESVYFDNAYAGAANSAPSRACLMSGKYAPSHGVYTVSPSDRGDKTKRKLIAIPNTDELDADFFTLPEMLQKQGYYCAHIGKWHLGDDVCHTGPLSQGFHLNVAGGKPGTPYSYFYPYKNRKNECHIGLEDGKQGEYLTDRLTDEAIQVIREKREQPFFLYLAHHAVHTPMKAPKDLVDKYKQKKKGNQHNHPVYAAMIESLDTNIGRILKAVEEMGIEENTVVVFYSDNGGLQGITSNFPLRGGKGMPYEGGIRVPLLIKYPEKLAAGSTCSTPVTAVDFYPSLQALATGDCCKKADGENIFEIIDQGKRKKDLFWHFPAYLEGPAKYNDGFRAKPYSIVRSGDWKLIFNYEDDSMELYNLKDDLQEKKNLVNSQHKQAKALYQKLVKWTKESKAHIPTEPNPHYQSIKKN